jgi:hypothetical protein
MNRTHKTAASLVLLALALAAPIAFAALQPVVGVVSSGAVYVIGGSLVLTDAMGTDKVEIGSGDPYPDTGMWLTVIPSAGTVLEMVVFDSTGATEVTTGDYKEGSALTAGALYEWSFGLKSGFQYDWRPATSGTLYFVLQESRGAPR